jgi:hypothetical protein
MTMGIGTPSSKSKIERTGSLLIDNDTRQILGSENNYMIPLPAPDGRGVARTKRANQESKEHPQR